MAQLGVNDASALSIEYDGFLTFASVSWGLPPHGAYELPLVNGSTISPDWIDALLFITALCGDESLLQQIFLRSPAAIKFEERWSLRSKIPLPISVWQWIEVLKAGRNGSFTSTLLIITCRGALFG